MIFEVTNQKNFPEFVADKNGRFIEIAFTKKPKKIYPVEKNPVTNKTRHSLAEWLTG